MDAKSRESTLPQARIEPGLFAALGADLAEWAAFRGKRYPSLGALLDALLMPGVMATIVFRACHSLHRVGLRPLSRLAYIFNVVVFGCDIAPPVLIGPGLVMPHPVGVVIAGDVKIGSRARIMAHITLGGGSSEDPELDGMPQVGDDCWLLDSCKAFGRLTIGDGAVVGASAVVLTSVPPLAVVVGIPARVVRTRSPEVLNAQPDQKLEAGGGSGE